jgi:hypothetical protein
MSIARERQKARRDQARKEVNFKLYQTPTNSNASRINQDLVSYPSVVTVTTADLGTRLRQCDNYTGSCLTRTRQRTAQRS